MKTILLLLLLQLAAVSAAYPQIMQTLKQVIDTKGAIHGSGYTEADSNGFSLYYITFETQMETVHSGKYTETRAFYFTEKKPDAICFMWKIIEPISEVNSNVKYYNLHMVKLDDLKWKDYQTGLVYSITLNDGLCITTCSIEL